MEKTHKEDGNLKANYLAIAKKTIEEQFTSIMTLEIFLKNNPIPSSALAPSNGKK